MTAASTLDMDRVRATFDASHDFTVLIEEEFAILDPDTWSLAQRFEGLQQSARLAGVTSTYAYNAPRPEFDAALRRKAADDGVRIVNRRARVRVQDQRLTLDAGSLQALGLDRQPDLLVDCTGRALLFRRALALEGTPGKRRDTCLFAHFHGVELGSKIPGCVVLTMLEVGWAWRIPLTDRMSVGVVMDSDRLRSFGNTLDERLENALAADPIMATAIAGASRVSPVRVYNNYQWLTDRFRGENWGPGQ